MQLPEDQLRAGHIPSEIYQRIPHGSDLRKVVIVQEAPAPTRVRSSSPWSSPRPPWWSCW